MNEQERYEFDSEDGRLHVEIRAGEHNIVFGRATGHHSLQAAKRIVEILHEIRDRRGENFLMCIDASRVESSDPAQRKYMREQVVSEHSPLKKFAVVGGNFIARGLYNMFAKVSSVPMKLFKDRDEAISWLMEGEER